MLLLGKGADPIAGGLSGEGALAKAVRSGYTTKVALILERGADPKTKNEALFIMGESGPAVLKVLSVPPGPTKLQEDRERPDIDYSKTVGLLLDHGADIEARNEEDDTPLIWAAENGQTDVVRGLLERGADVEAKNKYGGTALGSAACECATIDMPETLESMKLLLEKGAKANAKNKAGSTALMAAASAGRTENMQLLLDKGATIDSKDNDGNTALLVSAGAGPYSAVGVVYTVNPVKLLLERGADIEARNKHGDTALILAASRGGYEDAETVRLLLERSADVGAKNNRGQTALDLALKNHRTEIVSLLRKAMESRLPWPNRTP
jgi:ankyrin repeat protein